TSMSIRHPAARRTNPVGRTASATASPVMSSSSPRRGGAVRLVGEARHAEPWISSKQMDLNAFVAAHEAEWARLEKLAAKRRLTGREVDELIDGYQAGITDLSALSTTVGST